MSSDSPKQLMFSYFADLAKVLGNGHRLELIELLAQGEQPVEVLARRSGLSFANASQHLQQLRKAGLVLGRRSGKNIIYRLADGPIVETMTALRKLAEHNVAAVRDVVTTYFDQLDNLDPVGPDDLMDRVRSGSVTLLDVRPEDEFRAGHIPGALNIDLDMLESRMAELPVDMDIVAYCRGAYCVLSFEAVRLLRARGFRASRFSEGLPEWRASGRAVATA
jgi:rhodanese-related sulfurtransferase/DNA-binding transcriptional ArsR family regulator